MLKLSDEALGALMMALQKSLIEQSDIVPVLQDFEFQVEPGQVAPREWPEDGYRICRRRI